MAKKSKVKVKVKAGSKGKPLGERVAEMRAKEGEKKGNSLAVPKVQLTLHLDKWRGRKQ